MRYHIGKFEFKMCIFLAQQNQQNLFKFRLSFGAVILFFDELSDVLMGQSFSQNFSPQTQIGQKLKISTLDDAYSLHNLLRHRILDQSLYHVRSENRSLWFEAITAEVKKCTF